MRNSLLFLLLSLSFRHLRFVVLLSDNNVIYCCMDMRVERLMSERTVKEKENVEKADGTKEAK